MKPALAVSFQLQRRYQETNSDYIRTKFEEYEVSHAHALLYMANACARGLGGSD